MSLFSSYCPSYQHLPWPLWVPWVTAEPGDHGGLPHGGGIGGTLWCLWKWSAALVSLPHWKLRVGLFKAHVYSTLKICIPNMWLEIQILPRPFSQPGALKQLIRPALWLNWPWSGPPSSGVSLQFPFLLYSPKKLNFCKSDAILPGDPASNNIFCLRLTELSCIVAISSNAVTLLHICLPLAVGIPIRSVHACKCDSQLNG